MSKYKHTPAPWKVKLNAHPTTDGRSWGWVGQDKICQLDEIPGVNVTWEEGKISEANAKLISAAPELLEELQGLVRLHHCEMEGMSSGRPTPAEWVEAVNKAEKAINKATGE